MTAHTKELNSERLLRLSDEVSRIASTLAQLSNRSVPRAALPDLHDEALERAPEISAKAVGRVLRARRLRARFFEKELFADPAWDMMLHLLHAELTHQRVSVTDLCQASAVPATTGLRWLKTLIDKGLFARCDDLHDARRSFVELAPETSATLRCYFADAANPPMI
jgi:DNA-binding MarR family transcriptional regulator